MKIAVVAGSARSLLNFRGPLLAAFRSAGHEVVTSAAGADGATLAGLAELGVRHHDAPLDRRGSSPLGDLRYWRALRALFRREQPDLVFAYTMKPVIYAALAAKAGRPPARYLLITGLGYGFGTESPRQALTRAALRPLLGAAVRRADGVIFQNDDDRRQFDAWNLLQGRRTLVVRGSGVDLARFPFSPPDPDAPPRFLLLARMVRAKGVGLFVEAARAVRERHPEARFVMAGSVEYGPDAISAADLHRWHASGVVEYLGRLERVQDQLARCTACVLPSYYREGMPRSLLEAMSTGRAIVTTDTPGCRDTVADAGARDDAGVRLGRNGLLVPPRSVAPLTAALCRLADARRLAADLGRAGRLIAETDYDVRLVNRDLLTFLGLAPAP